MIKKSLIYQFILVISLTSLSYSYYDEFSDEALAKFNDNKPKPIDLNYPKNYWGFFWAPRFYAQNFNNWLGFNYDFSINRKWGLGTIIEFDIQGRGSEFEINTFYVHDRNLKFKKSENMFIMGAGLALLKKYDGNDGFDKVPFIKLAYAHNLLLGANSPIGIRFKPNFNVLIGHGSYSIKSDNVVFDNKISDVAFGFEIGFFFWTDNDKEEK